MKNNVKIHRAIVGYAQQYLAKKIGVSRQTINAIESGKYVPSTVLSLKIAQVFEKSMEDLFSLEGTD